MQIDAVVWVGDGTSVRRPKPIDWRFGRSWNALHAEVSSQLVTLDLDPDLTVAQASWLALKKSGRDASIERSWLDDIDISIWMEEAVTGEQLPHEALVSDHLDDGDTVLVKASVQAPRNVRSITIPLSDPEVLFNALQAAAALETVERPRLWGALLYTEEDVEVATYVRTYFEELNSASGELLRIFVVEQPADWRRAKKYWRPRLERPLFRTLSILRWLTWTPYDKSGIYDVARELGVDPTLLPCLVLFGGTEDDRIVFPIPSADAAAFRGLFSMIHRAVGDTWSIDGPEPYAWSRRVNGRLARSVRAADALRALAASSSWADRKALARVEEVKRSLLTADLPRHDVVVAPGSVRNLTFTGPTTFINNPVNTVVRNFQNTDTDERRDLLAELLSLAVNSKSLLPEDQADLARQVAGLVDAVRSGRLSEQAESIARLVEGSDIADRASEIIDALRKEIRK